MLTVMLPVELHAHVKSKAALERMALQEVVQKALEKWLAGISASGTGGGKRERTSVNASGLNIPQSMVPLIEWLLDLFAEKGDHDEEMLKDTLRLLTARRAADLKRTAQPKERTS